MWVLSRDPTTYFEKYGKKNKDTLTKLMAGQSSVDMKSSMMKARFKIKEMANE